MAITEITRLYHRLLPAVPEHMSALNVCLVRGCLRPATLVEGDGLRKVSVNTALVSDICEDAGLFTDVWAGSGRLGPNLLVWNFSSQSIVDRLYQDPSNDLIFGEVLGYHCIGDLNHKSTIYHHVDFAVRNPNSGNPNPFLSYICNNISPTLRHELREEAKEYKRFFSYHEITDDVRLHVWTNQGRDIIDEWF